VLKGANLSNSSGHRTDFASADLSNSNLSGAALDDATLKGAVLKGANLSNSSAHRTDFASADLSNSNLSGADLDQSDFSGANLTNAVLTSADIQDVSLKGAILNSTDLRSATLNRSDLTDATLTNAKLGGAEFERAYLGRTVFEYSGELNADFTDAIMGGTNLQGLNLSNSVLKRADLSRANLSHARLSGANLERAFLESADLSNTDLSGAKLTEAYLYDADLTNANMENTVLIGARFSGANLTRATLRDAKWDGIWSKPGTQVGKVDIEKGQRVSLEIAGLVTSIIPDQAGWLITTQGGGVFRVRGKDVTKVFDVSGIEAFSSGGESGLLSIAVRGDSYYLAYTLHTFPEGDNTATTVIVNEYTRRFKLLRNVANIEFPSDWHHGGTLGFDEKGSLYLSTGDGEGRDPQNLAQNPEAVQGKILRFDVSDKDSKPKIIARGLRNPWKFSIDQRGRMFIGDVGGIWREEVNLISDLYTSSVPNFGHRVFEGSKRVTQEPIELKETVQPIFEYEHHRGTGRPISVIGGYYLDEFNAYVFGGTSGFLRVLKEQPAVEENGASAWREVHFERVNFMPTTFGYDGKDRLLVAGPDSSWVKSVVYDLDITEDMFQKWPWVRFCETVMPDGVIRNDHCTQ
jgi:uncharacterized protein YjbI with pentapeptide repeats